MLDKEIDDFKKIVSKDKDNKKYVGQRLFGYFQLLHLIKFIIFNIGFWGEKLQNQFTQILGWEN